MLTSIQIPELREPPLFLRTRKHALEAFKASHDSLPEGLLKALNPSLGGCVRMSKEAGGCVALPFSKAFSTYGALISKTFMSDVQLERDPLFLLSHAMHTDGLFIYVPPGVCIDDFSLEHYLTGKDEDVCARVHIVVGKEAELYVRERFTIEGASFCMTQVTCEVEAGGKVFFDSFSEKASSLVTGYRVYLKEGAVLSFTAAQEARFSRSAFHGVLQGRGASLSYADFSHVACGMCSERSSNVEHKAPETSSQKYVKKVIADGGTSRYTGKISIEKEGAHSQARQMHRALTLGENAVCHASPLFDIFQSDTQAFHGSTIAPFDETVLFYARARGIEAEEAKKFLIQAFCDDIVKLFPKNTRAELEKRIAWIH